MFSIVGVFKIQIVEIIMIIMHSWNVHSSLKCAKVLLRPLWLNIDDVIASIGGFKMLFRTSIVNK